MLQLRGALLRSAVVQGMRTRDLTNHQPGDLLDLQRRSSLLLGLVLRQMRYWLDLEAPLIGDRCLRVLLLLLTQSRHPPRRVQRQRRACKAQQTLCTGKLLRQLTHVPPLLRIPALLT